MSSSSLSRGKTLDPKGVGLDRNDLPPIGATPAESRFDLLRQWWPAARHALPLELEIGSGKGTFLTQQAGQNPDVNYLGIEWARPFWLYAADRLRRNGLEGRVRLLHTDAGAFVNWYVPDQVFRCAHIYFPDPWPKKRHNKRRLIQAPFLEQMHRTLIAGGSVRLVTDHDDYFQWMNEEAAKVTHLFAQEPFERPDSAGEGEVVGSNFERKYKREGRPFNAMALRKI